MAKIAPKLNKVSPKMAKINHIWSMWRQVQETWSKSYCHPKILLATRLLGFTTFPGLDPDTDFKMVVVGGHPNSTHCPSVLVYRHPSVLLSQCPGVPVSHWPGVSVSRCLVSWYSSVPVFQCPIIPESHCPSNLGDRDMQRRGDRKHTILGQPRRHKNGHMDTQCFIYRWCPPKIFR